MNQIPVENKQELPFTTGDWDMLRYSLRDTVMAKTNLCSLAKNMGLKWPIRGNQETPERYLGSTLEELSDMEEFYGKGNRLALLYSILVETKRLDDPFAEMTKQLDVIAEQEAAGPSPLQQLEVPEDFPMELVNFSERTLNLCREGGYETISQLIEFLQKSASATIMNDEFRDFLKGLHLLDTSYLKQCLPLREGTKGIFLAEALGHVGSRLYPPQAATLIHAYKLTTTKLAWNEEAVLPRAEALALIAKVKRIAEKYFDLMPDQAQQLRCAIDSGLSSSVRFFVSLNDPDLEGLAIAIAMAAMDVKPRLKGGLIERLLT